MITDKNAIIRAFKMPNLGLHRQRETSNQAQCTTQVQPAHITASIPCQNGKGLATTVNKLFMQQQKEARQDMPPENSTLQCPV